MSPSDRIAATCERRLDPRSLRVELLAEIRAVVPFDSYAWLLTDPETCVGSAPLAETPSLRDLPTLIRLKYLTPTNRWTASASGAAMTLLQATGGEPDRSRLWAELLAGYGIDDVASVVFRDRHGCWGFLDLWRRGSAFTAADRTFLDEVTPVVTAALRRSLLPTFEPGARPTPRHGPVVLLLSDDLTPLTQTPETDELLRALLPTDADRAPVPAGAYNVAAELLAVEQDVDSHPPRARVHLRDGHWVTLGAARMAGPVTAATIAVTIEATPPAERTALYARVTGLSTREAELLGHLVAGCDTRELAQRMFVSEHTVQDHLKSVFAKSGTNNRRALVARASGAA